MRENVAFIGAKIFLGYFFVIYVYCLTGSK